MWVTVAQMAPDSISTLAGRQLSLRSRMGARRLLDSLSGRLEKGEQPLHLATSSSGLMAATDRRLIVMRGVDDVDEIPYAGIISFAAGKSRRKPFIQLQTDAGEITMNGLGGGFGDICRLVHTRMWDVSLERLAEPARVEPIRRAAGGIA
jgi:hypothetical protein